ncbi:energy transducer TonB [Enterovirga sp. GCM10030262]|uniref:energy transducer TonB n=1 Tax=Enterovirga sp. GCM10030262 TaxID=3273391 RepID=UPI0036062954
MIFRSLALAGALSAGSVPALAADDALQRYETAFAQKDWLAAVKAADDLVLSRMSADGQPKRDPFLNGIVGISLLTSGEVAPARAYLEKADSTEYSRRMKGEVALALGEAQARDGDWRLAIETYRSLDPASLDPDQQRRRALALGRELLILDPMAAIASLGAALPAISAPADRWEIELVLARAQSLAGDAAGAREMARRSWADAAFAPAAEFAPMRIALVRAALAEAPEEEDLRRAMLQAAGGANAQLDGAITEYLPLCGEEGLRAEDHATFTATNRMNRPWATLVSASRPEAARTFASALGDQQAVTLSGESPGGTVFTLRCRSTPTNAWRGKNPYPRLWAEWAERHGLFPTFYRGIEVSDINALAERVERVEQRFGTDSPFTIMPRSALVAAMRLRAVTAGDIPVEQIRATERRIEAASRALGGLESLSPPALDFPAMKERLRRATTPEAALALGRDFQRQAIEAAPPDLAYRFAVEWLERDTTIPASQELDLVDQLIERLPRQPGDRRHAALRMKKAKLLDDLGETRAARDIRRSLGLPDDHCLLADTQPVVIEAEILSTDYPAAVARSHLTGRSFVEFGLNRDGRIENVRHLVSAPSSLFNETVETELAAFRYAPARRDGRSVACVGELQSIVWNLPESSDVPDLDLDFNYSASDLSDMS